MLKESIRFILRVIISHSPIKYPLRWATRSGLIPTRIWAYFPIVADFDVSLPDEQTFRYSATKRDASGIYLYWGGLKHYEAETIPIFYELARASSIVLDIGANAGVYSMIAGAANPNSKIIAFEPVPETYKRLVNHVHMNGLDDRCVLCKEAASNFIGSAKLHVPRYDASELASLHPGHTNVKSFVIDVPVTTIDTVCSTEDNDGSALMLVKIDVEGSEDRVLEGMQRTLADWAPLIIVECLPNGPYKAIEAILSGFGYRFFHLRKEGPVAVEEIIPDESRYHYRNFLCLGNTEWARLVSKRLKLF